jgi:hypothetical protein
VNVSATTTAVRQVLVQPTAPRDADGDHDGTKAAPAAAKPGVSFTANGSVDGYA